MRFIDDNRLALINTLLYVITKLDQADFHKIFKILYFAEQEHIKRFGKPLLNDDYIAMKYGPVPSIAYGMLCNAQKGDWKQYFEPIGKDTVRAAADPDLDYLSESERNCIDKSLSEFGSLNFNERTDKSHDDAYNATILNHKMDIFKIGEVGGATVDTLNYMHDNLDTKKLFK